MVTRKGFVWDTTSHPDNPGNVPPETTIIDEFLYNEGVGENDWVVGIDEITGSGTTSATKETEYLRLEAVAGGSLGTSEVSFVTDDLIDLTPVNVVKINIDLSGSVDGYAHFVVSDNKNSNRNTFDVSKILQADNTGNHIITLDVSALTGEYYIRIHAYDILGPSCYININSVQIEGESGSDYTNVVDVGVLENSTFSETLTGLTPNTTYYYRGFGYDETEYLYGAEVSFTTDSVELVINSFEVSYN